MAVNKNNLLQYCYATQKYPNAKIVLYDSSKECIDAVRSGRTTATLISAIQADRIKDQNKELNTLTLTNSEKLCFGVSIKNSALLKLLNHGITVLGESYGVDHVFNYVNEITTYTLTDLIKEHIWIVIIVFIVVLLLIILYFMMHDKKQKERAEKELQQKEMLQDALKRAKQATMARTVFLRNMSHDIRTPLNAVIGFTELAHKEENMDHIKDYLSKINLSGNHLLEIVNEVLEISRIESGQTKLEEKVWDLKEIVKEVEVIITEQAKEKRQAFHVDIEEIKDSYIYCDKLRIKEILLNLLGNSVKFTNEEGKISLTIRQKHYDAEGFGCYQMIVQDNGCGMSQEFIDKIFEPFEREYTSTDSGIEGTGLGMPIVKHFVDMMNGTIRILSKENEGTKIIVEFKFCLANQDMKQEENENLSKDPYHFKEKRLMLVEDNELNREITEEVLKEAGFQVDSVENGKEAIKQLTAEPVGYYDLILMDIQMPVMDGYEATRQIRNLEDQKYAAIPIIALSANAFEEDKESSYMAGMNEHLAKPMDVNKLMKILKHVLK